MTTEQKTAAIQKIVANHQDNDAARKAARISARLEDRVIEAMNNACKDDMAEVFLVEAAKPANKANHAVNLQDDRGRSKLTLVPAAARFKPRRFSGQRR